MNRTNPLFRLRPVRIICIVLGLACIQYLYFHQSWRATTTTSKTPPASEQTDSNGEPVLTLVVAGSRQDNGAWITTEVQRPVNAVIYIADDPAAQPTIPAQKGNEAMVYMSYIIDNYDKLPEIMVFMRAQQHAQHQDELSRAHMPVLLARLRTAKVLRDGYFNLRCTWEPGCPDHVNLRNASASSPDAAPGEAAMLRAAFRELLPAAPRVPEVLAQPAGAQFAASRARVRAVPRDLWRSWRDWLVRTELGSEAAARVWEYLWQYVLLGQATACPVVDQCYCEAYGVCFMSPVKFSVWRTWTREVVEWEADYAKMEASGSADARFMKEYKERIEGRNGILKMALDAAISWGDELRDRGDELAHYAQRPTEEQDKAAFGG